MPLVPFNGISIRSKNSCCFIYKAKGKTIEFVIKNLKNRTDFFSGNTKKVFNYRI